MGAIFRQTGQGGKFKVILFLRRHKIIHDVGSCVSLQCGGLTYYGEKNLEERDK